MAKKKKVVGTPFGQAQAAPKASASPNEEARRATESYASPFSTAFGGSAPSTELDAARQYASPFSTAFGGTAPTFESEAPSESPIVNKEVDEEDEPEGSAVDTPAVPKKFRATDGTVFEDEGVYTSYQNMLNERESALDIKRRESQSAYDLLYSQFAQYGMGSLVEPLKQFIQQGLSRSEFTLRLRETEAYKKRFAANAKRIASGLTALDEADYIGLEDQYQNIMRQYGLPASYYAKGELGIQEGFEKFIANDVSAAELEDRVMTAQSRVINANPQVSEALKQFYPGITNGDILAYTLDPTKGLEDIKRKVTAAEIGGAAIQSGLKTGMARAEELGKYGVDKAMATEGYSTIGAGLQRGSELASIYQQDPYTQTTAEEEVFRLSGAGDARKKRQKITGLEKATFGGQTGLTSGALARDRAGGI